MHINNPDFRDGVDQRDEDQQEESIVKPYPENPCFFDFVFHGLEAQGVLLYRGSCTRDSAL